ncbi:helix-turn-helix domain-containing protein [Microbacterium enclense]|uniref:helix-turn-helix domain-containing protein n=1 Tax=Microbacterium enclense TaxID=993073 RepID=UPI00343FEDDE
MDRSPETASPVEKARIRAGVPMLRLEHMTGITRNTLKRKIENPETLSLRDLKKIAAALDVDAARLFVESTEGVE